MCRNADYLPMNLVDFLNLDKEKTKEKMMRH